MSWINNIESYFVTTEAFVIKVVADVRREVLIAEHDVAIAMNWVVKNIPQVVADLQEGVIIIESLGVTSNPEVAIAIAAANAAVAGLNAFESKYKVGTTDAATVANGYNAIKQASAAVASAVAAGTAQTVK